MPPIAEPKAPTRRLSVSDAIIGVAAACVWLALTRSYAQRSSLVSIWFLGHFGVVHILRNQGGFFLVIASLTMLLIRLRGPRPTRRRLWRQPGLAASAGATAGILVGVAGQLATRAASAPLTMGAATQFFDAARPFAAPGVAGAWLALALTGRWRSERGAIDRLGRLVGLLWLLEFPIAEMPGTRWIPILVNLYRQVFP